MAPIISRAGWNLGFSRKRFVASAGGGSLSVTGGNQTPANGLAPGNGYIYHTFTSPGTLTVTGGPGTKSMEVLIVGGGAAGGSDGGGGGTGGGGAGGILDGTLSITPGTYPITVGSATPRSQATNGNPSSAFGATANGGGFGGYAGMVGGAAGGSGGGGTAGSGGLPGGASNQSPAVLPYGTLTGYGFAGGGGGGPGSPRAGGGGGGAAQVGGTGSPGGGGPSAGGNGRQYPGYTGPLIGVPTLAPLSGYFAGGGAGALGTPSTGGLGGGGNGGPTGTDGATNSGGGGGGGASYPNPGVAGGAGGSGIVIIRYLA
jgi:hypothetical protein